MRLNIYFYQIAQRAPLGDLKKYVLDKKCRIGDLVTFLSQVASAVHYLHVNHIVHGDLRAEHVSVIAPEKVSTWYYYSNDMGVAIIYYIFHLKVYINSNSDVMTIVTTQSTLRLAGRNGSKLKKYTFFS